LSCKLDRLKDLQPLVQAANLLLQGPCAECGLLARSSSIIEAQSALDILNARIGSELISFNSMSKLWYGRNLRDVADFVDQLVGAVEQIGIREIGMPILSPRDHYRGFVRDYYPLPPRPKPALVHAS
jgi:hypothetical protein